MGKGKENPEKGARDRSATAERELGREFVVEPASPGTAVLSRGINGQSSPVLGHLPTRRTRSAPSLALVSPGVMCNPKLPPGGWDTGCVSEQGTRKGLSTCYGKVQRWSHRPSSNVCGHCNRPVLFTTLKALERSDSTQGFELEREKSGASCSQTPISGDGGFGSTRQGREEGFVVYLKMARVLLQPNTLHQQLQRCPVPSLSSVANLPTAPPTLRRTSAWEVHHTSPLRPFHSRGEHAGVCESQVQLRVRAVGKALDQKPECKQKDEVNHHLATLGGDAQHLQGDRCSDKACNKAVEHAGKQNPDYLQGVVQVLDLSSLIFLCQEPRLSSS
ncbi:hypothetical protein AUP68_14747 [Ilyonectria robusta]